MGSPTWKKYAAAESAHTKAKMVAALLMSALAITIKRLSVALCVVGRIPVLVAGATGVTGRAVVNRLANNDWFEIVGLTGSPKSARMRYGKALEKKRLPFVKEIELIARDTPKEILEMKLLDPQKVDAREYKEGIIFCPIEESSAGPFEEKYARHALTIGTSSAHRMDPDVPLVIPSNLPAMIPMLAKQRKRGLRGGLIKTPNCTAFPIATTLSALLAYGLYPEEVHMVSMQALSGAGEKGLTPESLYYQMAKHNVIPYIEHEEEKVERETRKMLSIGGVRYKGKISATCNRVHVVTNHSEWAYANFDRKPSMGQIEAAFRRYRTPADGLPSAPEVAIKVSERDAEIFYPMPSCLPGEIMNRDRGMMTYVGRIEPDNIFHARWFMVTDNIDAGAAGTAVLAAEYAAINGLLTRA